MHASPNKPPTSANQKDALPSKNTNDQSGNPLVRKNSTSHDKPKSDFPGNNNPDQVPAYMNAMKIVPSPTFNFDRNSGLETVQAVNTQPKSNSQLQNSKSLEISDRIASPIPKVADQKAVNKSHSLPSSNESGHAEHDVHSDKNSTEENTNTTPDEHEVHNTKEARNKLNTEPAPVVSSNREKAPSVNKGGLLDNDCSGIPLNIQMLKAKFKDQEAKIQKQDDKEETKKSRPNNQTSSIERNNPKSKPEEAKKEKGKSDNNTKADPYLQPTNKPGDGQSNWLQKKFTEAALVKKDEPVKKTSPYKKSIDTSEDGAMHHFAGQGIKVNTVKTNNETDSQANRSQTMTSPSKPPTPASQTAEQPKKAFKMLQETVSQAQYDRNGHTQYFQMHDPQHRTQSPFMNDMNSLNASQSEIIAPSRDPVNVSGLLDNSHLARMTNWPGNPHLDFTAQNWHGANPQEYQKKTLSIINFYEQHLNNFKNLIIQQTNVIEAQKFKITNIENLLKESNDKVKIFEEELYKQTMNHQKTYQELLEKYSETVSQLNRSQGDLEKALKKLGEQALHETGPPQTMHTSTSMSPQKNQDKAHDNLNNLYQEIFSIKKDLNSQREIMKEMRQTTPPKYETEPKENVNRSRNSSTYLHAKDESDPVHPLRASYDRGLQRNSASSSVPKLFGRRDRSNDTYYDEGEFRGRANPSVFANQAQLAENAQIANQSRQNAQGGRVRDLLNWQSPPKHKDSTFVSPTRSTFGFQGEPVYTRVDTECENDMQNLTCDRNINNRSTSTDAYRQSNTYICGLSNQKPRRKNSEEIEKLQQIIRDLYYEKKAVEDELLKFPENWKTLEQRRRKAKIESELERIEERMEGYKNKMRELTGSVSPVKQRR